MLTNRQRAQIKSLVLNCFCTRVSMGAVHVTERQLRDAVYTACDMIGIPIDQRVNPELFTPLVAKSGSQMSHIANAKIRRARQSWCYNKVNPGEPKCPSKA